MLRSRLRNLYLSRSGLPGRATGIRLSRRGDVRLPAHQPEGGSRKPVRAQITLRTRTTARRSTRTLRANRRIMGETPSRVFGVWSPRYGCARNGSEDPMPGVFEKLPTIMLKL